MGQLQEVESDQLLTDGHLSPAPPTPTLHPQVPEAVRPEVQQRGPRPLHQAAVRVGHAAEPGASHDAELRPAAHSASQVGVTQTHRCTHTTCIKERLTPSLRAQHLDGAWGELLHIDKRSQFKHLIWMPLCGRPRTRGLTDPIWPGSTSGFPGSSLGA